MAKEAELGVYLVDSTRDPEQVVAVSIRRCYSNKPALELMEKISEEKRAELIKMVNENGHVSTTEHAAFVFAIEGISRTASHQLVRHRIASYSQESQRYVDLSKEELLYIVPPKIRNKPEVLDVFQQQMRTAETVYSDLLRRGIDPEDARFVLPNATETKIMVTMNSRAWGEFLQKRLCRRAQWEIRGAAMGIAQLLKMRASKLFENVGPTCLTEGICWEGKRSCGLWQAIEGGEMRVRQKHHFKGNHAPPEYGFLEQ